MVATTLCGDAHARSASPSQRTETASGSFTSAFSERRLQGGGTGLQCTRAVGGEARVPTIHGLLRVAADEESSRAPSVPEPSVAPPPRSAMNPTNRGNAFFLCLAIGLGLCGIDHFLASTSRPESSPPSHSTESHATTPVNAGAVERSRIGEASGSASSAGIALDETSLSEFDLDVRGGAFIARISDSDGRPIAGATARFGPFAASSNTSGLLRILPTNGALRVSHPDFLPIEFDARAARDLLAASDGRVHIVLPRGFRISGRVTAANGTPIRDVLVTLMTEGSDRRAIMITDGGGRWSSPLLDDTPTGALIRHPEYCVAWVELASIAPGSTHAPIETTLARGRALRVIARDAGRQALADATIWLEEASPSSPDLPSTPLAETWLGDTDDLGELRCHVPTSLESVTVIARLVGFREHRVRSSGGTVTLVLDPAPLLEAQTIDATSGLPATPLAVELERQESDGAWRSVEARGVLCRSLASGRVRVGLPPEPGSYRVLVRARGNLRGNSDIVKFDGKTSPPTALVRLERVEIFTGVVHGAGKAIADAEVEVVSLSPRVGVGSAVLEKGSAAEDRVLFRTRSRASGRFEIPLLPEGICRIVARHPDFAEYASPPLTFPFAAANEFPILLRKGGIVRGRVITGAGSVPVPEIPLSLSSNDSRPRYTWSDSEGEFEFAHLTSGASYSLAIANVDADGEPRSTANSPAAVRIVADQDLTIVDIRAPAPTPGSLEGRLSIDDLPLAAALRLVPRDAGLVERRIHASADGSFQARAVLPGRYRLRGPTVPCDEAVVIESGRRVFVDARVRTARIDVRLRGAADALDVSARVELRPETDVAAFALASLPSEGIEEPSAPGILRRRAEKGRTVFARVFPGSYRLSVLASGYLPWETTLEVSGDETVDVPLEKGKEIRIRLRLPDGTLYRGLASVDVRREGEEEAIWDQRLEVDGFVDLPPLAAGVYEVAIRAGSVSLAKRVTIR
jgi:hypothetical protein